MSDNLGGVSYGFMLEGTMLLWQLFKHVKQNTLVNNLTEYN